MKYVIVSLVMIGLILMIAIESFAAEDRQPKTVRGKVTLTDGTVVENAMVTVTCKNNTLTDVTSRYGNYEVLFGNLECEQFDTVYIHVEYNGLTGMTIKEVQYFLGVNMPDIVLTSSTEPVSVPEFSSLSAIMAGSVSLLAFARLKRA